MISRRDLTYDNAISLNTLVLVYIELTKYFCNSTIKENLCYENRVCAFLCAFDNPFVIDKIMYII